jgi:hypothetical protein
VIQPVSQIVRVSRAYLARCKNCVAATHESNRSWVHVLPTLGKRALILLEANAKCRTRNTGKSSLTRFPLPVGHGVIAAPLPETVSVGSLTPIAKVLKPVTFRYKREVDPATKPQFGLVAEDVEAVNPDLVVRDKQGEPYSVRYDQVNAMLLNEFLKEHRRVQEQQAVIAQLKGQVAELKATSDQKSRSSKNKSTPSLPPCRR